MGKMNVHPFFMIFQRSSRWCVNRGPGHLQCEPGTRRNPETSHPEDPQGGPLVASFLIGWNISNTWPQKYMGRLGSGGEITLLIGVITPFITGFWAHLVDVYHTFTIEICHSCR